MRAIEVSIWTWLVPEEEREIDRERWSRHGGKWIIFDNKDRIVQLAGKLQHAIDSGEIVSAKYWNGDPSAINVYSLDTERERVWKTLEMFGASGSRVWEYDYAMDKNLCSPFTFAYSWFSKFSTILQSYGLAGSFRLFRDAIKQMKSDE